MSQNIQYEKNDLFFEDLNKAEANPVSSKVAEDNEFKERDLRDVPTLFPKENFNKYLDVEILRKSMKGLGTDEQPIIEILCNRSNQQRRELKKVYSEFYKRDLLKDLHSELSGHFREVIELLMKDPSELDAYYIRKALMAPTADYKTMIEILATRSCFEIMDMKMAYEREFKTTIEQELQYKFDGPLLILLDSLLTIVRSTSNIITISQVVKDLKEIFQHDYFNQEKFINCLSLKSYSHLRAMFEEYKSNTDFSIEEKLKEKLFGPYLDGVICLIECIRDKNKYFATTLYNSMKGLGTNNSDLIRVILTRCEIDMDNIKKKFNFMYNFSLPYFIKDDTSGYYCKSLLMLIGERNSIKWSKLGNIARYPVHVLNNALTE